MKIAVTNRNGLLGLGLLINSHITHHLRDDLIKQHLKLFFNF